MIFAVIGAICYVASLFFSLSPEVLMRIKDETKEAIDKGDTQAFSESITHPIKEDLASKKAHLIERVRQKLKDGVDNLIDTP